MAPPSPHGGHSASVDRRHPRTPICVRRLRGRGYEPGERPPYAREVDSDHRAAVSDLPWIVPLGVVVLVGTWFTNVDDFSRAETLTAASCAAVAIAGLF